MIIEELYKLYDVLASDPKSGISPANYMKLKVSHEIILNEQGDILGIIDIRDLARKGTPINKKIDAPFHNKRTSKIDPRFMCDNIMYTLGIPQKGKKEEGSADKHFEKFKELHFNLISEVDDEGAKAFLSFLAKWNPATAITHSVIGPVHDELQAEATYIAFRLNGDSEYIFQRSAIKKFWQDYQDNLEDSDTNTGICIITGKEGRLAKNHPLINEVPNGLQNQATLVSFNNSAFTSYGKQGNANAPISNEVVFKYTTAWNHLATSSTNTVTFTDIKLIFWAETAAAKKGRLFLDLLCHSQETDERKSQNETDAGEGTRKTDKSFEMLMADVFYRAKNGMPIMYDGESFDGKSKFYILGYTGNSARLAIKFWHVNTFGNILRNIENHVLDMQLKDTFGNCKFIPVWKLFKEITTSEKKKKLPPQLYTSFMQSMLFDKPYSKQIFMMALDRCKKDGISYPRISIIKAYLSRQNRKMLNSNRKVDDITMELNENNKNTAYNIGRLFAVLERIQTYYHKPITLNKTIKDNYLASASSTPYNVFPHLIIRSQSHLSKIKSEPSKKNYGIKLDKLMTEIMLNISSFPKHHRSDEQGEFLLGYFQQLAVFYKKNETKNAESEDDILTNESECDVDE